MSTVKYYLQWRRIQFYFLSFITLIFLTGCNIDGESPNSYTLSGLNLGPFILGKDPNQGDEVSASELMNLMTLIDGRSQWLRVYSMGNGVGVSGGIAKNLGYNVVLSAWIGRDSEDNEAEIDALIDAAQAGEADIVVVGSEALLRRDVSAAQLISYIERVKASVTDIPVAYADQYDILLLNSDVIAAVDIVFANYYPYWSGVSIDNAVGVVHSWHQHLRQVSGDKAVFISETGWPSCGDTIGNAVATNENAAKYFLNFVSWARANDEQYFYFSAFDEEWKIAEEGPQGACWGIWDGFGNMKNGMSRVFSGSQMNDNWSNLGIPGGPGETTIEFTYVPPIGSFENLLGQVLHISPQAYRVAVYIRVSGRWWTKPYFDRPLSNIQADGTFNIDITTGGVDQRASDIAAFVLPSGFSPPLARGTASLPRDLATIALVSLVVTR